MSEHTSNGHWVTIDEGVALLGGRLSRSALYRAANRGDIPCRHIGRRILLARRWFEPSYRGASRPHGVAA